jgi:hypothetical protein
MSVLDRVLFSKLSRVLPRIPQDFRVWAVKKWAWASTTSIPTIDFKSYTTYLGVPMM